jgi:acyl-CoA synthetase (AMP-forming)/AMP-acid ligase II
MPETQRALLEVSATHHPNETAIRIAETGETLTYREFDDRANQMAEALTELGVRRGDRVAMVLFNTIEFPTALYGCHKIDAIPVILNYRLSVGESRYIFDDVNPEVIIFDEDLSESIVPATEQSSRPSELVCVGGDSRDSITFTELLDSGSPTAPPELIKSAGDVSYIFYTSGTTGDPKGVVHTVRSGKERINAMVISCGLHPDSVGMPLVPFVHGAGLLSIRSLVAVGAELVVTNTFEPEPVIDAIEEHDISYIDTVPTVTERIANYDGIDDHEFSTVECWANTGEVMTEERAKLFTERLTPNIYNAYGTSEIGQNVMLYPGDLPEQAGAIGRPIAGSEVRIIELDADRHVQPHETLSPGEEGEIIIRSDQIFRGYFGDEDTTRETVHEGWFYTKDVGYVDEDGYLTVTGRADDMIISGGENISPVEVESVLKQHERVSGAIVVGIPHEDLGQQPKAFVVADGLTAADLEEYCREHDDLADFKRPREYEFVEELARNEAGKKLRGNYRDSS